MQTTVVAFSAIFMVLLGLAAASEALPQIRERRAPVDTVDGFERGTWDETNDADVGDDFEPEGIAKRIADNDFATMRHQERQDSMRQRLLLQAMNEIFDRAGKRSFEADKRSLTQNDYMMLRQDLAKGQMYRSLLDRMLTEAGKR